MVNDILRDMDIDDATQAAHSDGCIECLAVGCSGCPAGAACELPHLIQHEGEWMCPECVPAFDAHVANRCTGDACNCASDGVPVLLADDEGEETTPIEPLTNDEIAKLDPLGVFSKEAA